MNQRLPIDDERLSAYLDDELSRDERTEIESLLERDEEYRTALEELRSVRGALKSLPGPALPGDFADRVRAQVQAAATSDPPAKVITPASKEKSGFQSYIGPLAALAALVVAMLVLPSVFQQATNVATKPAFKGEAAASSMEQDELGRQASEDEESSLGLDQADAESYGFSDELSSQGESRRELGRARMQRAVAPAEPVPAIESFARDADGDMDDKREDDALGDDDSFNSFNLDVEPEAVMQEMTAGRAAAKSKVPAGSAVASGGAVSSAAASPEFSLGCDAVCEVKLESREQTDQFFKTLSTNNVRLNSVPQRLESMQRFATVDQPDVNPGLDLMRAEEAKAEDADQSLGESLSLSAQPDDSWLNWASNSDSQAIVVEADAVDVKKIVSQLRDQSIAFNILTVAAPSNTKQDTAEPGRATKGGEAGYGGRAAYGGGAIVGGTAGENEEGPARVLGGDGYFRGKDGARTKFGIASQVQLSPEQTTTLNRMMDIRNSQQGTQSLFGQDFYYDEAKETAGSGIDKKKAASPGGQALAGNERGGMSPVADAVESDTALPVRQSQQAAINQILANSKQQQQQQEGTPKCKILFLCPQSSAKDLKAKKVKK